MQFLDPSLREHTAVKHHQEQDVNHKPLCQSRYGARNNTSISNMDVINSMICLATINSTTNTLTTGKDHDMHRMSHEPADLAVKQCRAMSASGHEQRKSVTREREKVPQVLTVKETMLDTNVVNAEGMKVSCLGMGLMRSCTFCIPCKQLTPCQSRGSHEQGAKYSKTWQQYRTDGCPVHKHYWLW